MLGVGARKKEEFPWLKIMDRDETHVEKLRKAMFIEWYKSYYQALSFVHVYVYLPDRYEVAFVSESCLCLGNDETFNTSNVCWTNITE
jgi:hypothetical protein